MTYTFLVASLFGTTFLFIVMTLVMHYTAKDEAEAQKLLKETRHRLEEAQDELAALNAAEPCSDVRFSLHRVGADKEYDHECELVAVVTDDKNEGYEVQFVAHMTREEVEDLHGQLDWFLNKEKA